ncbi:MAG: FAD-binding oxidoreductase [Patescibacteria group bacterium]
MATRSLTIVDVDAKKTRTKKTATAQKTAVLKKQTTTKAAMPSNADIMASIKKTKKAVAKKTVKAKTAVEIVGSAETTPVTILTIPLPKKVAVKKATLKKKSTKAILTPATHDTHAGHDHSSDRYPTIVPRHPELQAIKRHPLGHLLLEKKLREAGFRGGISSDKKFLEKYSTDESIFHIRPQVVLQPKSKHDIEIATKLIAVETKRFSSLSLTPRAAGTGLSGGSLTDSIVIDVVPHMHKIGEVKKTKDGATITCEPGAFWRDVEKKLKKVNCYIPSYTSSKDICTIGGAVANNAAGPDSLRYGHCADWVESLDVILADGNTYTMRALSYKEFKALCKEKNLHATIAQSVFEMIEKNETVIKNGHPKTPKGNAGYPLWNVIPQGVENFKKGIGVFDLTRLVSGSQGTVGIITHITMKAIPIQSNTTLITIPIFDLQESTKVIIEALKFNPINIEIFDALTFDLALKNPDFFKARLSGIEYYKVLLSMYTTYHIKFGRKIPEFTIILTVDEETTNKTSPAEIVRKISTDKARARIVKNSSEIEMYLQIRRASYTLSKFLDPGKRPAAFLEDMTVPPENLAKFFIEIKRLFKEFNVQSAIHGHGGNGHFHFYPLLDFTSKTTPLLVEKMAEKFYDTAVKYKGNICGEHNDGIMRTPYLYKMFSKQMLDLFTATEHLFDPDDIFNPGKKVNPRFDIKKSIRHTN